MLKQWVEKHYYDFEASPQLLRDLKAFVYGTFSSVMAVGFNVSEFCLMMGHDVILML